MWGFPKVWDWPGDFRVQSGVIEHKLSREMSVLNWNSMCKGGGLSKHRKNLKTLKGSDLVYKVVVKVGVSEFPLEP